MEDNDRNRPLWFTMLVFVSIIPLVLWFMVFSNHGEISDSMLEFVMSAFPFAIFGELAFAYYLYPQRRELAWVLMTLVWVSHFFMLGYWCNM